MRDRLRVAVLSETNSIGGAEVMSLELSECLISRGHDVTLFVPGDTSSWMYRSCIKRGIPVTLFERSGIFDLKFLHRLYRDLKSGGFDVVHGHLFGMSFYAALLGLLARIPSVITLHNGADQTAYLRRRLALRFAIQKSSGCTVVSERMRIDLLSDLGSIAKRLVVIPNGVKNRKGVRSTFRNELGLSDSEKLVVAVGSCCIRKNHVALINALASIPRELPWRLAIAGREDDATPMLMSAIEENSLEGRVHLLGAREDIPNILAAAEVFAMPSFWEGMPLALIEAMQAGVACIASDVGGVSEILTDGTDGFLFDLNDKGDFEDKILTLLSNDTLREEMSARAQSRSMENHSITGMCDAYENMYYSVLDTQS